MLSDELAESIRSEAAELMREGIRAAEAEPEPDVGVLGRSDGVCDDPVLPPVRAGVATGEVVAREGDYSGNIVNLASRALTAAPPSTLLVDRATRDAIPPQAFVCGREQAAELKGFDTPVPLFALTRRAE